MKRLSHATAIEWSEQLIRAQQTRNAERLDRVRAARRLATAESRPPKPKRRKPKHSPHAPGVVYIVRMRGLYKIGMSSQVERRIAQVAKEIKAPRWYTAHTFTAKDRYALEQQLHRDYAHRRVRGEWFDLTDNDLLDIISRFPS